MKDTYTQEVGLRIAVLDCLRHDEADCYLITRINVPIGHRGQGIASELLRQVCEEADYEDEDLMLEIAPSGGLEYDQLEAWYVRNGFEKITSGPFESYFLRKANE